MKGDAFLFVYDGSATGRRAHLPGWELRSDGGSHFAARGGTGVNGVAVPVSAQELTALDEMEGREGLARAIAMVEIEGTRTWAFFYTRTSDWRERKTLQIAS